MVKRSKVNLQGAGVYCGGLPHSLLGAEGNPRSNTVTDRSKFAAFNVLQFLGLAPLRVLNRKKTVKIRTKKSNCSELFVCVSNR